MIGFFLVESLSLPKTRKTKTHNYPENLEKNEINKTRTIADPKPREFGFGGGRLQQRENARKSAAAGV